MRSFVALALFIALLGVLFKQELVVGLAWLLGLALLITWVWRYLTLRAIRIERSLPEQAFLNDQIEVELRVGNRSRLPLPWLTLHESVPGELQVNSKPNWLLNLHGHEQQRLGYQLLCKTRGRYWIGPMEGTAGVVLEPGSDPVGTRMNWPVRSRLTVYPQIVSLERLGLPSRMPLGNLKTRQPLLYDPSRLAGIRDYYPGDDPRHIDWRNTARLDSLQVKQFDPTRQMPLAIFLDLKLVNYQYWRRFASEVGIVVAASLANRANGLRQPFGLYSNGFDPAFRSRDEVNAAIPVEPGPAMTPGNGDAWLGRILDKLAGLQPRLEGPTLPELIGQWTSRLAWGATVAIIALEPTPALAAEMLHLRKAGYSPVAIFTAEQSTAGRHRRPDDDTEGQGQNYSLTALRGLGLVVYEVRHAEELNIVAAEQSARL